VFALPALAIAAYRARVAGRVALWGAAAAALLLLPIVARGGGAHKGHARSSPHGHDMVSGNNLNTWWIATWIVRSIDSLDLGWWRAFTLEVRILQLSDWMRTYPDPRPIGTAIVSAAIAWGCWRMRADRSPGGAARLAAWSAYAYTMFATRVHENHLYLALPLLMIAAGLDRSLRSLAWAVSAVAAVNLYLFYGLGDGWPPAVNRAWTGVDLSVWLAFVNVGVFVWATRSLARPAA
jgi:hypothetical protein